MTGFLEEAPGERSSSRLINVGTFAVLGVLTLWAAWAGQWEVVKALATVMGLHAGGSYVGGRATGK